MKTISLNALAGAALLALASPATAAAPGTLVQSGNALVQGNGTATVLRVAATRQDRLGRRTGKRVVAITPGRRAALKRRRARLLRREGLPSNFKGQTVTRFGRVIRVEDLPSFRRLNF